MPIEREEPEVHRTTRRQRNAALTLDLKESSGLKIDEMSFGQTSRAKSGIDIFCVFNPRENLLTLSLDKNHIGFVTHAVMEKFPVSTELLPQKFDVCC